MNAPDVISAHQVRPGGLDHHNLTFRLPLETLACIIGPNETGKSSWLRMFAGIEPPVSGELRLLEHNVQHLPAATWRHMRKQVGYIGPRTRLLSVFNGLDNVLLPALYHGIDDETVLRQRALKMLHRLGWDGDLDSLPAWLDPHSRQLLALARCLLLGPELLLIDEPFGPMDTHSRLAMEELIASLVHDQGLSLVIVTHNLNFVRSAADVIMFADGTGLKVHESWDAITRTNPEFVTEMMTTYQGENHAPAQ